MKLAVFWQFSQLNPEWEEIYYKPTFDKKDDEEENKKIVAKPDNKQKSLFEF